MSELKRERGDGSLFLRGNTYYRNGRPYRYLKALVDAQKGLAK